ncbi:unknown [Parabacteroides sp. CAG:2]|nr:unknown [Parabacteroides sp. CAG:2]
MTRLLLNLIGKHQGEVRMRGKKRVNFFPSFLRCMGGKQGANPSGGEKDIASPLYFRHRFQGRTDISDRLLFSQAMVQMSESRRGPWLHPTIPGDQQGSEDTVTFLFTGRYGWGDKLILLLPVRILYAGYKGGKTKCVKTV